MTQPRAAGLRARFRRAQPRRRRHRGGRPAYDHAEITAFAAATLAYELVSLLARKAGRDVLSAAEPVPWPNGALRRRRSPFDVDAESAVLGVGDRGGGARLCVMSHQAYGPLTGVPRAAAHSRQAPGTGDFFVPGYTAHRYPDAVRAIVDGGHEIAHHGYLHEPLTD